MKTTPLILASILVICFTFSAFSQTKSDKKPSKKNLTVKEWNTNSKTKTKFLDHITRYNSDGQKIEEIEYANYGIKSRIVYEYDSTKKCIQETEYDGRDRVVTIKKFEYNLDGTRKKQLTYSAKGKLESVKEYEYIH